MSLEEAIEEMKSLSPSEAAIEMVLKHLKFYKNGLEREIENNRNNVIEIIRQDKIINEMAEHIVSSAIVDDTVCSRIFCEVQEDCSHEKMLNCTKQYFEKKVEEK